jgi:hypothetical protein
MCGSRSDRVARRKTTVAFSGTIIGGQLSNLVPLGSSLECPSYLRESHPSARVFSIVRVP